MLIKHFAQLLPSWSVRYIYGKSEIRFSLHQFFAIFANFEQYFQIPKYHQFLNSNELLCQLLLIVLWQDIFLCWYGTFLRQRQLLKCKYWSSSRLTGKICIWYTKRLKISSFFINCYNAFSLSNTHDIFDSFVSKTFLKSNSLIFF